MICKVFTTSQDPTALQQHVCHVCMDVCKAFHHSCSTFGVPWALLHRHLQPALHSSRLRTLHPALCTITGVALLYCLGACRALVDVQPADQGGAA